MHTEKLTSGWFENTAPGVSVTETVNTNLNASPKANTQYDQNLTFMISRHDAVPYEEIYDTIMHSGQISDEEKTYIASLEQTRRLVNRLGGLETLLEKPKVHHIVKRQTNGGEACVLLKRRRRRAADEAGETERTSRIRRGISNVGRNLEQAMGQQGLVKTCQKIRYGMMAIACVGIMLSTYALHVEVAKEGNKSYQAMCDISSSISCSKVFTSRYGRGFGLIGQLFGEDHFLNQPNSIFGIIFYCIVIILGEAKTLKVAKIQLGLIASSNLMSMYLAYLLYFVLRDFCVICVSTYIVNALLTLVAFKRVSVLQRMVKVKSK